VIAANTSPRQNAMGSELKAQGPSRTCNESKEEGSEQRTWPEEASFDVCLGCDLPLLRFLLLLLLLLLRLVLHHNLL